MQDLSGQISENGRVEETQTVGDVPEKAGSVSGLKRERITRLQWSPRGITVYTTYGMETRVTEADEFEALTNGVAAGLRAVEELRAQKKAGKPE